MKTNKVMHFITTIIILIMTFAVLSTATYAWYTVVNRAVGNNISFSAASNEGGGDLAIAWNKDDTTSFVLTFDDPINSLYPMIPKDLAIIDVTKLQDFAQGNFFSSNQTKNTLEEWICSIAGQHVNPHLCKGHNGDLVQDHFYLINRSVYDMEISVIYDITGALLRNKLHVAMFVGTTPENMVLKGIMSNNDIIHYGEIFAGQKVDDIATMPNVFRDTTEIRFNIPKDDYAVISVVAWLDGAVMTDDDAETSAVFGIRFDGTATD